MGGIPLEVVSDCQYLGVNISHDLSWKNHINKTAKKASSTVGFLRRNFRNCPQSCKKLAYISLVRSKLEYAATVWDPYTRNEIDKLERVQRQGARFIKMITPVENLDASLGCSRNFNSPFLKLAEKINV